MDKLSYDDIADMSKQINYAKEYFCTVYEKINAITSEERLMDGQAFTDGDTFKIILDKVLNLEFHCFTAVHEHKKLGYYVYPKKCENKIVLDYYEKAFKNRKRFIDKTSLINSLSIKIALTDDIHELFGALDEINYACKNFEEFCDMMLDCIDREQEYL